MISKSIVAFGAFLTLVLAVLVSPSSSSFAQAQQNPAIPNQTDTNTGVGPTNTDTTTPAFDWTWLLPLIIGIPVVFFLLNRGRDEDTHETYRSSGYAGAKGGRTRREVTEEEVVD